MKAQFRLVHLPLLLIASVTVLPLHGQRREQESAVLVLTNATVVDGLSPQATRRATVTVRGSRIERVSADAPAVPAGATVLDLKGLWLLPGLIDAHVHFADLKAARTALASGVTTLRTGSSDRFLDIGVRELNHGGARALPDVVAAGYQVLKQPAELFFVDFPKMTDLSEGVSGPENVRRMVHALIDRGVNVIKILATERAGLVEGEPRRRTFTDEELAAAVDEAKRAGIPVAAHAHGDEGAAAAIRAGVRSIEHGTYMSDETLAMMKDRGTYLVPTVTTGMRETGGRTNDPVLAARSRANQPRLREMVARAIKLGVKVVAGTDVEYADKYRLQDELSELVKLGLSPRDAIGAATSTAADCLMISARTGSIRPGLEADLIAVDRDPTVVIDALRDVLLVVNNGRVAVKRFDP